MSVTQDLKQILARLESLTSGTGDVSGPSLTQGSGQTQGVQYPPLSEFDAAVKDYKDASDLVAEAGLKQITELVLQGFEQMKTILTFSYDFKKPTPEQVKAIQKPLSDNIAKVHKLGANQAISQHVKVVVEGLTIVHWVTSDTPQFIIQAAIEPAEYNGTKVQQAKIPENTKWYVTFMKTLKALQQYQKENFPMGLNWNSKGTKSLEDLVSALSGESKPAVQAPAVHLPPPPTNKALAVVSVVPSSDPGALFSQINVGEDITKRLKKVDKAAVQQQKDLPTTKAVQKQQVKVENTKIPKRHFKEHWFLENFQNDNLIEFKEDEIDMKQSLFIDNCSNCGVLVKTKIKSIFLQNCSKIQLVFEQVVSGVEIVGCKRIEATCLKVCPSFMVDNSESIHLTMSEHKECDIYSAKTIDFNITYLQADGEYAKDTMLPEQFITVWDKEQNRYVSKPHEAHFG